MIVDTLHRTPPCWVSARKIAPLADSDQKDGHLVKRPTPFGTGDLPLVYGCGGLKVVARLAIICTGPKTQKIAPFCKELSDMQFLGTLAVLIDYCDHSLWHRWQPINKVIMPS